MQVKKDQKKVSKETKSLPGKEFFTNIHHLYVIKEHQQNVCIHEKDTGNYKKAVTGANSTPVSTMSKKNIRLTCI